MSKKQKKEESRKKAGRAVISATAALAKKGKEERLKGSNEKVKVGMKAEANGKGQPKDEPKAAEQEGPAKEAKRTIKAAVVEVIATNPGVTNGELTAKVKAEFPVSAFNAQHASWYRMQLNNGKLTGTKVAIPPSAKAPAAAAAN